MSASNKKSQINILLLMRLKEILIASVIVSLSFSISGCATTMKEKIVRNTLLAGAAGVAVGSTKEQYKSSHELMYGATAAALAAIASVYYYDPDREIEAYKKETESLKSKLDQVAKPTLIEQGSSLFKAQVPSSLSKLVQLGEWKHYKMDEWVQDANNPNLWLRQVEMYEVVPPSSYNQ